jgi:hypothetical protein
MIERISNFPNGCEGVRGVGQVTREDYQQVLEPLLDQAHREGRRVRFLYQFGAGFESFTPGAAWEDMKVGFHHLGLFERLAVVSDISWIRGSSRAVGVFLPCPLRIFSNHEWDEALAWLSSPLPPSGLTHRMLPDVGVLVVEPHGALRAEDFETMALTVDPWIEKNGSLHGLVVHFPQFPGWENFGALVGHLRFVRDHHHQIQRVALASDGLVAELVPKLAQHFVQAQVKRFQSNELEAAISWASARE